MAATDGGSAALALQRLPDTPGLRDADPASKVWVQEFFSCFGGRVATNKFALVAALEAQGYDSKRRLQLVQESDLVAARMLMGDAREVLVQLQYFSEDNGARKGASGSGGGGGSRDDVEKDWSLKIIWPALPKDCAASAV